MSLRDWLEKGWLSEHRPVSREIADLLAVADRSLRDCQATGLSFDGTLDMAHNAALQSAAAALCAAGFRATRESYHYYVIESLAFTLALDEGTVRTLHKLRRKRNVSDYERAGAVTEQEAQQMLELARQIRQEAEVWIRIHHPELAKDV